MSGGPRVVLVGPPGAGKTTIGGLLAAHWQVPFADTDQIIEQAQGRRIADIFVDDGEPAFRRIEQQTVLEALAGFEGVLALGGGAVVDPEVRSALSGHRVVFLDVAIADAATRVGFSGSRPLLAVNPRASWTRMMQVRRPVYEEVATVRVDTAGQTPQEVLSGVLDAVGAL